MTIKKIFWVVLVFTIIIWIGVGFYYFGFSKSTISQPKTFQRERIPSSRPEEQKPTPSNVGWLEFKNDTYGFAIKYPQSYTPKVSSLISSRFPNTLYRVYFWLHETKPPTNLVIIEVTQTPYSEEVKNTEFIIKQNLGSEVIKEKLSVGTLEGLKLTVINFPSEGRDQISAYFPLKANGQTFIFRGLARAEFPEDRKNFTQMLESFRHL